MNYLTCYKVLPEGSIQGGRGQGGGNWWTDVVGIRLQQDIAHDLGEWTITLDPRPHGKDSFDCKPWTPPDGNFDAAYVQLFDVPTKRPAKFVWSFISDYVGMEGVLESWLAGVRPNLLISLQYPLIPPFDVPTVPTIRPKNLVRQCEEYDCDVIHMPWFNEMNINTASTMRDVPGMCTGKMSGTYPWRDAIYKYLDRQKFFGVILSGNPHGSEFKLSDEEYRDRLSRCRYYFSGGIYDFQVPPKYFEVCNYGAALVTPNLPMLKSCGFIHGKNCLVIHRLDEIPMILQSNDWIKIGKEGQKMVHEKHSMDTRAKQIADEILKRMG